LCIIPVINNQENPGSDGWHVMKNGIMHYRSNKWPSHFVNWFWLFQVRPSINKVSTWFTKVKLT